MIPAGKELAVFSVTPGQIVDFLAFKDMGSAKKIQKHHLRYRRIKTFPASMARKMLLWMVFASLQVLDIAKKVGARFRNEFMRK